MRTFIKNISMEKLFRTSLKTLIDILIIFMIVVLAVGLAKTIYSINELFYIKHFAEAFNHIITDILSFLVILEIFRSFIEYFKAKRFRLHSMMDSCIILIIRELIVVLYAHKETAWQNIIGFAILIMILGMVRTLALIYTPERYSPESRDMTNQTLKLDKKGEAKD